MRSALLLLASILGVALVLCIFVVGCLLLMDLVTPLFFVVAVISLLSILGGSLLWEFRRTRGNR